MIKDNSKIQLTEDEISFFLKKIDAAKLGDRISKHYNIKSIEKFREFLEISPDVKLSESLLIKVYKDKDMPNEILNENEKIELKKMYLKEIKTKLDNKRKKEKAEIERKQKIVAELFESSENLIITLKHISEITTKQRNQIIKKIDDIKKELQNRTHLELEDIDSLETFQRTLDMILNKPTYANLSEKKRALKQKELSLEYYNKMKKIKELQEKELLDRINNRKNENTVLLQKDNDVIKNELVVIEAYSEDFCSEKSRFLLSVLHGNNIKISFYNGTIKLLNENDSFSRIEFSTAKNIMSFITDNLIERIELDLNSNDKIIDLLSVQTSNKDLINKILDCISVLYYINTFYNEKEKIDVSYEDLANLTSSNSSNVSKSDSNKSLPAVVYLSNGQTKKIKTIKIKKGKRGIAGSFLIRGHWRRQKYTTGVKLIWIEPFWKGIGKAKLKIYKIKQ